MKRTIITLISTLLLYSVYLPAQESQVKKKDKDQKTNPRINEPKPKENKVIRWNFGINVGAYHANNYMANYYNGNPQNIDNVQYVMSNPYWYQDIKNALGSRDTVVVDQYPTTMHYNITMMAGFMLRYNINKKWGVCLDVNYTQLKADAAVTFTVDPTPYLSFQDIRLIPIRGVEKRVHIDLLLQRNFPLRSKIYFFVQGGVNINYTEVTKSSIFIESQEYSMINNYGSQSYVPGSNQQQFQVTQGGFGLGGALHGGIGIPLAGIFGVEPGGFINYNNVNLTGYPAYKISYGFYLRLLFGNILPRPDPDESN